MLNKLRSAIVSNSFENVTDFLTKLANFIEM